MTKIRLVTFYEAPNWAEIIEADEEKEVDEQLEQYARDNIDNITAPGFEVEDFEVPDTLDRQLILDICNGKSMGLWTIKSVDFNNEMWVNWIFYKNKDNHWEEFDWEKFDRDGRRSKSRTLHVDKNATLAERYTTICNLIEAIWFKRKDEDYYNIDLENLPNLTSPQSRKIANFIMEALDAYN